MYVVCKSPFQAEISFKDGHVHIIGSVDLMNKMNDLKTSFGKDPRNWPVSIAAKSEEDLLINEFIHKCHMKFKMTYEHVELCHCRMVPTERVFEAIKQGCRQIEDIGRATLAGTGCGSCKADITALLEQFKIS